jgi:NADPH2:quinone reductase
MPRAVLFQETGGPEVLTIEEVPDEAPGAGEVKLRVLAFGLNRSECQLRAGTYPMMAAVFPSRIGREACGIVEAVGAGVEGIAAGDWVTTIPNVVEVQRYGVYGDMAIVPAGAVAPWPDGLSATEATAVWQQYLTAYGPLVAYGKVGKGDVVLITAATSSVGHGCIELAKAAGATTIATTRDRAKRDDLTASGADHVIVTSEEDLVARVLEITGGGGARVVLDPIAGPGIAALADAAAQGGEIYLYGQLDRTTTPFPLIPLLRKGLTIRGYTLWEIVLDRMKLNAAKSHILGLLGSGAIRPRIDRVFSLEEIVEAHRYMESNRQNGKIVVAVDPAANERRKP